MEGTTVDVFAARIFLFRAAIQTQSSGVKAKEATASCVTNYGACGVPEGQSSYYIYFLINDCSCCFGLAHQLCLPTKTEHLIFLTMLMLAAIDC